MDEIRIAIKYSNRKWHKTYIVTGADFTTMKNDIKATGAQYEGSRQWWIVNKAGFDTIKSKYTVKAYDLVINTRVNGIFFYTTDDCLISYDPRHDDPLEIRNDLQSAYSKSDDEFITRARYWADELKTRRLNEQTVK